MRRHKLLFLSGLCLCPFAAAVLLSVDMSGDAYQVWRLPLVSLSGVAAAEPTGRGRQVKALQPRAVSLKQGRSSEPRMVQESVALLRCLMDGAFCNQQVVATHYRTCTAWTSHCFNHGP